MARKPMVSIVLLIAVTALVVVGALAIGADLPPVKSREMLTDCAAFTLVALLCSRFIQEPRAVTATIALLCAVGAGSFALLLKPVNDEYHPNEKISKLFEIAQITMQTGIVLAASLYLRHFPWARLCARLLIAIAIQAWFTLVCVTALLHFSPSIGFWTNLHDLAFDLFWLLVPTSLLFINMGQGDRRHFRWPGLLMAAITLVAIVIEYFGSGPMELWRFTSYVGFPVVAALAGINLLLMSRRAGLARVLKWAAIAMTIILAWVTISEIHSDSMRFVSGRYVIQIMSPAQLWPFLITMNLYLALTVASRPRRTLRLSTTPAEIARVEIICPICTSRNPIALSNGACPTCRLGIEIRLTEPRCPQCDYLLYHQSTRCPECGCKITASAYPTTVSTQLPHS